IYRINQPMIWGDWSEQMGTTGPGVAEAIRAEISDFEEVTRILYQGEYLVRVAQDGNALNFNETEFYVAEDNFFRVLSFPFLSGDPRTALKEANSVVITGSTARRYFGDADPMGKTIEVKLPGGAFTPYTVTGVLADIPSRSHLQFDLLASLASVEEFKESRETWIWTIFGTYGLIREGTDVTALTEKLQKLPPRWAERTTQSIFNQSFEEFTKGQSWTLYLQPLRDIYLAKTPDFNRFGPSGNPEFVTIFGAVGILVLVLSSINFMNLSTARSSNRAKEVGVRKVLGSQKRTLIRQFIVESMLYVLVAMLLAMLILQLSIISVYGLVDNEFELLFKLSNWFYFRLLIRLIVIVLLAVCSYFYLYFSIFNPIESC